ncbi:MAG: acyl carrier protein [Roseicyclus sp.]|nr:acyl carrier protein [Roseicyclus sp.]
MTIKETIKEYICGELVGDDVVPSEIEDGYDLIRNGVIDSLAPVRLVAWTAETFAVPINDVEIAPEDLSSVERIEAFISRHSPSPA